MAYAERSRVGRVPAATGAAAVVAVMGWALVAGLVGAMPGRIADPMQLISVTVPPPEPERPRPQPRKSARPEGEAAPPNLRAEPKPVVAPVPVVPLPSPVAAAPVAAEGPRATSGAAEVPGPGTGAGGEGDGRGGGGDGDGDGGGEGDGTPPKRIGGRLKDSDYPDAPREAGIGGTVMVRYLVGVRGRVERCDVAKSSGNAELDATTCRLIRERFRFRPSREPDGTKVPAWIVEYHSWIPGEREPATRR